MHLSRRASWLLLAFAAWSWFIWVTLVKNISADPRAWGPGHHPTAFLGIHVVLAIISLVFGTAIGRLGWRGLQATKTQKGTTGTGTGTAATVAESAAAEPTDEPAAPSQTTVTAGAAK